MWCWLCGVKAGPNHSWVDHFSRLRIVDASNCTPSPEGQLIEQNRDGQGGRPKKDSSIKPRIRRAAVAIRQSPRGRGAAGRKNRTGCGFAAGAAGPPAWVPFPGALLNGARWGRGPPDGQAQMGKAGGRENIEKSLDLDPHCMVFVVVDLTRCMHPATMFASATSLLASLPSVANVLEVRQRLPNV